MLRTEGNPHRHTRRAEQVLRRCRRRGGQRHSNPCCRSASPQSRSILNPDLPLATGRALPTERQRLPLRRRTGPAPRRKPNPHSVSARERSRTARRLSPSRVNPCEAPAVRAKQESQGVPVPACACRPSSSPDLGEVGRLARLSKRSARPCGSSPTTPRGDLDEVAPCLAFPRSVRARGARCVAPVSLSTRAERASAERRRATLSRTRLGGGEKISV